VTSRGAWLRDLERSLAEDQSGNELATALVVLASVAGQEVRIDEELPNTLRKHGVPGSALLFAALRGSGLGVLGEAAQAETTLLETYPADLFAKWARRKLPKKTTPQGRRARYDVLRGLGLELPIGPEAITHDQLDAAAAAFGAYLWATGNGKEIGTKPRFDAERGLLSEGVIVTV